MSENISEKDLKVALENAAEKAVMFKEDNDKLGLIMEQAFRKVNKMENGGGPPRQIRGNLHPMIRMVDAHFTGGYQGAAWEDVAKAIGAIVYFVSPVDLIPDFLPDVGFDDDAEVAAYALGALSGTLNDFEKWEEENGLDTDGLFCRNCFHVMACGDWENQPKKEVAISSRYSTETGYYCPSCKSVAGLTPTKLYKHGRVYKPGEVFSEDEMQEYGLA